MGFRPMRKLTSGPIGGISIFSKQGTHVSNKATRQAKYFQHTGQVRQCLRQDGASLMHVSPPAVNPIKLRAAESLRRRPICLWSVKVPHRDRADPPSGLSPGNCSAPPPCRHSTSAKWESFSPGVEWVQAWAHACPDTNLYWKGTGSQYFTKYMRETKPRK